MKISIKHLKRQEKDCCVLSVFSSSSSFSFSQRDVERDYQRRTNGIAPRSCILIKEEKKKKKTTKGEEKGKEKRKRKKTGIFLFEELTIQRNGTTSDVSA